MAGKTAEPQSEALAISSEFPTEGLPRPEAVNFTKIDQVGTEVQLSVGYVDLNVLVGLINQAKQGTIREASVKVDVTHRLVFSVESFNRLKSQVDQIVALMATNEAASGAERTRS